MKCLLDLGRRYAKEMDLMDVGMLKICLFSLGIVVGTAAPSRLKKPIMIAAFPLYIITLIPLCIKAVEIMKKENAI